MIVDTNVMFDLMSSGEEFAAVSSRSFAIHASARQPIINHIIFAEISPHFQTPAHLRQMLDSLGIMVTPITDEAAHRAGLVFAEYRRRGGKREALLPDFLIGAHAETLGVAVMTRDIQRFRSYFPTVELIDPRTNGHG